MMASIALGVMGALSAAGALGSAAIGSHAAKTAAGEQVTAAQQAEKLQQPFVSAGTTSIGQLMSGLSNGTFGPGSTPAFTAPTLADAQQTPGYQFTQQQGDKGILEGAGAAGGAISGGTLKALDTFNSGLANSTYNDVFSRALSGYGANLQNQAQQFSQLLAPAQLGAGTALNVGNLMTQAGNAQASGTVGSANALTSGITGATTDLTQAALLQQILRPPAPSPGITLGPSIGTPEWESLFPAGTGPG